MATCTGRRACKARWARSTTSRSHRPRCAGSASSSEPLGFEAEIEAVPDPDAVGLRTGDVPSSLKEQLRAMVFDGRLRREIDASIDDPDLAIE